MFKTKKENEKIENKNEKKKPIDLSGKYFTEKEVADTLNISILTLRIKREENPLAEPKRTLIGNNVYYRKDSFFDWLSYKEDCYSDEFNPFECEDISRYHKKQREEREERIKKKFKIWKKHEKLRDLVKQCEELSKELNEEE